MAPHSREYLLRGPAPADQSRLTGSIAPSILLREPWPCPRDEFIPQLFPFIEETYGYGGLQVRRQQASRVEALVADLQEDRRCHGVARDRQQGDGCTRSEQGPRPRGDQDRREGAEGLRSHDPRAGEEADGDGREIRGHEGQRK